MYIPDTDRYLSICSALTLNTTYYLRGAGKKQNICDIQYILKKVQNKLCFKTLSGDWVTKQWLHNNGKETNLYFYFKPTFKTWMKSL